MRWSDVTAAPSEKTLRQFAGLCLLFFVGLAGWRAWHGQPGAWTTTLAVIGFGIGGVGLVRPAVIRWIYTGWMMAAFPIGWTVFRVVLAVMFYGILTPVGAAMRLARRDVLSVRRRDARSYWTPKPSPETSASYFRQS